MAKSKKADEKAAAKKAAEKKLKAKAAQKAKEKAAEKKAKEKAAAKKAADRVAAAKKATQKAAKKLTVAKKATQKAPASTVVVESHPVSARVVPEVPPVAALVGDQDVIEPAEPAGPTRRQLLVTAGELGIVGRHRMSKEQLEAAVAAH
jgi:hypothetical protein